MAFLLESQEEDAASPEGLPDAPSALVGEGSFPSMPNARCCVLPDYESIKPAVVVEPAPPTEKQVPRAFQWRAALSQSAAFLSVQQSVRMLQGKTRAELGGPYFRDWMNSIEGIHGWGDGDGPITNYLLHPGMGGTANFIYLQNSSARSTSFAVSSGDYWKSRLKGMAFAAAYSTQFEIGPLSEASIGNVGLRHGTSGYVDLVMTPVGGFACAVIEDWIDSRIARHEADGLSTAKTRLLRSVLNPERSIANLLRHKTPWYRDNR